MNCPGRSSISRQDGNDLLLEIQIQPRASKNEICRLTDGRANVQLRLKIAKNRFKNRTWPPGKEKCIRIKELGNKQSKTPLALGLAPRPADNNGLVAD